MLSSTRCSTGVPHTASYLVAAQGGNSVDSGPGATPVPHKTGHEELIPDTSFPNLLDLSDSLSWNAHRMGNTWATSLLPVAYDRKNIASPSVDLLGRSGLHWSPNQNYAQP